MPKQWISHLSFFSRIRLEVCSIIWLLHGVFFFLFLSWRESIILVSPSKDSWQKTFVDGPANLEFWRSTDPQQSQLTRPAAKGCGNCSPQFYFIFFEIARLSASHLLHCSCLLACFNYLFWSFIGYFAFPGIESMNGGKIRNTMKPVLLNHRDDLGKRNAAVHKIAIKPSEER